MTRGDAATRMDPARRSHEPRWIGAVECLCAQGGRLRERLHLPWPEELQQAAYRLRFGGQVSNTAMQWVGIVGGASSGKSTLFDNLLQGRPASRVTAHGHATRGLIVAVHDDHRTTVQRWIEDGLFFSDLQVKSVGLDDNVEGEPDQVALVYHTHAPLREVLLVDTPDFTSHAAHAEGDVALARLPWFDRLLVVVDHERWFDRQSISRLRAQSERFGQQRFVLFNRTVEGELPADQKATLVHQSERLGATGMTILEFRRGRGLRQFPPDTLKDVGSFLSSPPPDRTLSLVRQLAHAANATLNQNDERRARLAEMERTLRDAIERHLPTPQQTMSALMTHEERKLLEPVARMLRLDATRDWLSAKLRRVQEGLGRLPLLGAVTGSTPVARPSEPSPGQDRISIGLDWFESSATRLAHESQRLRVASRFWAEMERGTSLRPGTLELDLAAERKAAVETSLRAFDRALSAWVSKVDAECRGLAPHFTGALGASALALAVVLVAVPGPLAALTVISAKGALGAALGPLVAASGLGAILGKPFVRLMELTREKLLGSPEFDAVHAAAGTIRGHLEAEAHALIREGLDEAAALVLPANDPLHKALDLLRRLAEESP